MKILVTGASGRVGSALVPLLLDRGDQVVGLDAVASSFERDGFSQIVADFSDTSALGAACSGVDAVLHLGAFMSWNAEDRERIFQANVDGTRNLLEAATANEAKKFVFASSGEVYPDRNPQYLPIDEEHPLRPTSPYGLSKLLAEEAVRFYGRVHNLPSIVLRFSHTQDASELLDPDCFFSGSRFYLHAKIRQQRSFGNHDLANRLQSLDTGENKLVISCNENGRPHRMGISDTRDTVAGVLRALDADGVSDEAFNLAPPSAVSFDVAIDHLQAATGLETVRINIPGPDLNYETDCRKAQELLGYEPEWTFERMVESALAQSKNAK